jgi:hypothetical protein
VEHSRAEVYDWLIACGLKFMPAVNWVERGMQGDGNSLPRYHIVWGTSRELTRMHEWRAEAGSGGRLTLLQPPPRDRRWRPRAGGRERRVAINEATGRGAPAAPVVVLAMGGINGSHEETRANWPQHRPCLPPCSTAPTRLPTGLHHWWPAWAGTSPTPARCGTTPPAFRIPSRTFEGMAVGHSLQVGAVAQPPGRAHRARAAGHRL